MKDHNAENGNRKTTSPTAGLSNNSNTGINYNSEATATTTTPATVTTMKVVKSTAATGRNQESKNNSYRKTTALIPTPITRKRKPSRRRGRRKR